MNNLVHPGKNPSKYIRQAYVMALANIGAPVWDTVVPADVENPSLYILIHDFTKRIDESCKDHLGWECSILVDIISIQEGGYLNRDIVDDLEEAVLERIALLNEFEVEYFEVQDTMLTNSVPNDIFAGQGQNIIRTVMTYDQTVYPIEVTPPTSGYVQSGYVVSGYVN